MKTANEVKNSETEIRSLGSEQEDKTFNSNRRELPYRGCVSPTEDSKQVRLQGLDDQKKNLLF